MAKIQIDMQCIKTKMQNPRYHTNHLPNVATPKEPRTPIETHDSNMVYFLSLVAVSELTCLFVLSRSRSSTQYQN